MQIFRFCLPALLGICTCASTAVKSSAQAASAGELLAGAAALPLDSTVSLPDSPGAFQARSSSGNGAVPGQAGGAAVPPQIAPKFQRIIKADQTTVPLTGGDKVVLALRQRVTPLSFVSTAFSAGYGHLVNNRPHFGTDRAGFGERLGGAEVRQTVEGLLTYGVYASRDRD